MDVTLIIVYITEERQEYNQEIYLAIIDHENAFGSAMRPKLWSAATQRGFPVRSIQVMKSLYAGIKIRMYPGNQEGRYLIQINQGVLQGCNLSFVPFNVYADTTVN
jgi:hypothetical protein